MPFETVGASWASSSAPTFTSWELVSAGAQIMPRPANKQWDAADGGLSRDRDFKAAVIADQKRRDAARGECPVSIGDFITTDNPATSLTQAWREVVSLDGWTEIGFVRVKDLIGRVEGFPLDQRRAWRGVA